MTDTTTTQSGEAPVATVRGTVIYRLSEAGQRAALAAGLPAAADQSVEADIPVDLLALCDIAPDGRATLALSRRWPIARPGWGIDSPYEVRHDSQQHDAPMTDPIAAYRAALARAERKVAETNPDILARRAESEARDKAYREINAARQAQLDAEVASKRHAEEGKRKAKAAALATWVHEHGTVSQRERMADDLLAESEILAAMADQVFGDITAPRYAEITEAETREAADDICGGGDFGCKSEDADSATDAQWSVLTIIKAQAPEGSVVKLRRHRCGIGREWDDDRDVVRFGVHVKAHIGPIALVREFAAPSD